jgi:hypothetical protein
MLNARLEKHFAVAATALSIAAASHAEVITWNINATVPATLDGLYMNLETQTAITTAGSGLPGWDLNPYGSTTMSFFWNTATGQTSAGVRLNTVAGGTTSGTTLSSLPEGFVIGPALVGGSSGASFGSSSPSFTTTAQGKWAYNAVNRFGFRFTNAAGLTCYGWGEMQMGATAGVRTILSVSYENSGGPITVGDGGGPPPAYDPCATFNPVLSSGANSVFMNVDTAQDLALSGCGTAAKANYYKYTAPYTGSYTFSTCASGAATRLAVLDGCAAGSNQLGCNDNACGSSSSLDLSLTSGQVVYVVVGGEGGTNLPSPIAIDVTAPPPPPSPNCATATALAFGSNAVDNATNSGDLTVRSTATTGTVIVYKARWFKFTPTVTGAYTFSACGSVNDTKMALAAECPAVGATFNSIAFNDDSCACSSGCGTTTQLNFSSSLNGVNSGIPLTQELVAGQTYLLVLGGYGATTATVSADLVVDGPPQTPPCSGDFNGDGQRDGSDLTALLACWGSGCGDLDGDATTGGSDLTALLAVFGVPCQ